MLCYKIKEVHDAINLTKVYYTSNRSISQRMIFRSSTNLFQLLS